MNQDRFSRGYQFSEDEIRWLRSQPADGTFNFDEYRRRFHILYDQNRTPQFWEQRFRELVESGRRFDAVPPPPIRHPRTIDSDGRDRDNNKESVDPRVLAARELAPRMLNTHKVEEAGKEGMKGAPGYHIEKLLEKKKNQYDDDEDYVRREEPVDVQPYRHHEGSATAPPPPPPAEEPESRGERVKKARHEDHDEY